MVGKIISTNFSSFSSKLLIKEEKLLIICPVKSCWEFSFNILIIYKIGLKVEGSILEKFISSFILILGLYLVILNSLSSIYSCSYKFPSKLYVNIS